ncbi:MAG: hypothetical protein AAF086_02850 [Planctomycetota bacterium]
MPQPPTLTRWLASLLLTLGPAGLALAETAPPTLIDMQVEPMPAVNPAAPTIEQLEVKATRVGASAKTNYSIALQGTLARPDGLDHAYGPLAWSVIAAHDADGHPMRFATEGYANPDALLNEPVDELYRRVGATMVRVDAQRLNFNVHLKDLAYLTPRFERLAIRSYAIVADDEQALELDLPTLGGSADVAGAWVLTVQTAGDRQELQLHAVDVEPGLWPLRLELIDGEGRVLSTGYRRGSMMLDNALATQWRFSQPTLVAPPATEAVPAETEVQVEVQVEVEGAADAAEDHDAVEPIETSAEPTTPAGPPDWRLRIHHAASLHLQQLDAVLGDVRLIDLTAPAESP